MSIYKADKISHFLPYLLERLPYCPNPQNSMLLQLLFRYCTIDFFFSNLMYRFLRYMCIVFRDTELSDLYTNYIELYINHTPKKIRDHIKQGTKWINKLVEISKIDTNKYSDKNKVEIPFSSPIHPNIILLYNSISEVVTKNSYNRCLSGCIFDKFQFAF